jgi:adenylosuccinate lyase
MIAASVGRIGNEVYTLQRPEIGELREPRTTGAVGSITMPHKRNPEASEHLVTLARLAHANASVLLDGIVSEHERDGRAWKAEWVAFPEVCLLTGASVALGCTVLTGLEVDHAAMARNLAATRGYAASERLLAQLAPRLGKHRAQEILQQVLHDGRVRGEHLREVLANIPEIDGSDADLLERPDPGLAAAMVDDVLRRSRAARRDVR